MSLNQCQGISQHASFGRKPGKKVAFSIRILEASVMSFSLN
jgi:hypothetical protein